MTDVVARGRKFERFVADLFRQRHFDVRVNAGIAQPRQTDIFAIKVSEQYLIECKWQQRHVDIDDIDSLRARLSRTRPDVVGLLISMSGFTEGALEDVRLRRQQPILLISGGELRELHDGYLSLPQLLARKADALLRDARVLLDEDRNRQLRKPHLPLPLPDREFLDATGGRSHVADFAGGFTSIVFTQELYDIDWAFPGGSGVSVDFLVDVYDELDLLNAFASLIDLGWVTKHGRWVIRQSSRNWYGLGVHSLIDELPRWQPRAEHHTEHLVYLDRCDNGFYTILADPASHPSRRILRMEVSFQLEGLPLDTTPLLQLCRVLGVHENLVSRPRVQNSRNLVHLRQAGITDLAVTGYLVADDPFGTYQRQWVTGIIVDNPFFVRAVDKQAVMVPHEALAELRQTGSLICDLRQHHPVDDPPSQYVLERIEWAWASDTLVCRPIADWPDHPR